MLQHLGSSSTDYILLSHQITLTGLSLVLVNFATLVYYDPKFLCEKEGAEGPPHWIYFTYVFYFLFDKLVDLSRRWVDGRQVCSYTRALMLSTASRRDGRGWLVH